MVDRDAYLGVNVRGKLGVARECVAMRMEGSSLV